jgi:magnesium transporter
MINTIVLDKASKTFDRDFDPSLLDEYCANEEKVVWVDIVAPTEEDFRYLAEEFQFHPLAIEDCRMVHMRPKIEEYKGYFFMVVYETELTGARYNLELRELNLFVGPNYLVTVHRMPLRAIESAARRWSEWLDRTEPSSGLLTYLLIDEIVDDYMPLLDEMSERLDDLEDDVFGRFDPDAIKDIFLIKKQLLHLRRIAGPFREVFNTILKRETPVFPQEIEVYWQDIYDRLVRTAELIDTLRDMVGSTMDAYLSVSGNRMNVVMKRLTSISTILMSVTLVAGIYGMNFEVMPELKFRYGYVGALLSMVVIGVVLYIYLRKIDWL